ncbi:hypothetical protein HK098_001406 [Nowakowskiella sp. JEL0407]|nr:hypothetical protein HK098_001406 [Nowakowskiella sp. JEL0407]
MALQVMESADVLQTSMLNLELEFTDKNDLDLILKKTTFVESLSPPRTNKMVNTSISVDNTPIIRTRALSAPLLDSPFVSQATESIQSPEKSSEPAEAMKTEPPFQLNMWDYLRAEMTSNEIEEGHDQKKERVLNFLSVPSELEKVVKSFVEFLEG